MRVLITGIGARCSLGEDRVSLWDGISRGESGISAITRFDVTPFDANLGALVPSGDRYRGEAQRMLAYARAAATEALDHAQVSDRGDVAAVLGTCNGVPLGSEIHGMGSAVVRSLGLGGPAIVSSTACASSAHAIAMGADLVRRGVAEVVLVGGTDTISMEVFAGFHILGLLSSSPCVPFSKVEGTTLGEGAAFMVLESAASVKRRGAKPVAELDGYGMSADAHHDTTPDPSGAGLARALGLALEDAGLPPEAICYYNAHGTGTVSNDSAEWRAVRRAFGDHATQLAVSASKSFLGHTLGACGALEAVVTVMALINEAVPPTLGLKEPRPGSPTGLVIGSSPRSHATRNAVSGSAGFGGLNAALVFGRGTNGRPVNGRVSRPVGLAGVAVGRDPMEIGRLLPPAELRGSDRYARLLTGAVAKLLMEGGCRLRTSDCGNIGLYVGQARASPDSCEAFHRSLVEGGPTAISALAFTRLLCSYATGACSRLLGLRGPAVSFSTGSDSGLTALVLAADYLAWHDDVDHMVAAAVGGLNGDDHQASAAAGILLGVGAEGTSILLRGWSLAPDCATAARRALQQGSLREEQVARTFPVRGGEAFGLCSVIDVVVGIWERHPGPVLIVGEGELAASAVILESARTACNMN